MSTLLKNLTQILFTSESRALPAILKGLKFKFLGVTVTYLQLVIIGTAILLCIALSFFLNRTRMGAAIRCVKQDRMAAALVGVDASRVTLFGNCLGSGLAGVAGLLYTIYYTTVNATLGTSIGRIGFSAAILGGMVSIPWAAVGGVVIGILENISIILIPANLKSGVAYLFLIVTLIFLPQGIQSRKRRRG
jgi:branched-chain amino acid transport system permease protein